MLTSTERRTIRLKLEEHEGRVAHMYLDSKGYVTVGTGHLLSTEAAAKLLPLIDADRRRATLRKIGDEYQTVRKQPRGRLASWYQQFTALSLPDWEIDRLTDTHIDRFYRELSLIYPGFESFPSEVRLALMDIVFNVGATNLRHEWPRLNAAIAKRDWHRAATECRRSAPVSAARNRYTQQLFLQVATEADVE